VHHFSSTALKPALTNADSNWVSARKDRDQLSRELEVARRRVAELELELIRRGRDPLTGVLRIEPFREHLHDEVQRASRHDRPSALVVLELDRLAEIHRDHGFEAGDALLRGVVEAVRAGTRAEDVLAIADYGGPVTAMVARDTLAGTQFHPEKSQRLGLALIANFLKWKP